MDLYALLSNRDVGSRRIRPATRVVIAGALLLKLDGLVRVPAKDVISVMVLGQRDSAGGDFGREAQPSAAHAVEELGKRSRARVDALQQQVDGSADAAEQHVIDHKAVKLMSVHGQVPLARELPHILLVDANAHQMRHEMRESLVVIAFDPDHLDAAPGIGKLADVGKKAPMVFLEPSEVQVAEDVAEQDQPAEIVPSQHLDGITRAAQPRAQV